MNDKFWKMFKNVAGAAEILIYEKIGEDFFGEGMGAKKFAEDLKGLGDVFNITLRINSPGGNVFDGMAIYNLLTAHKARITVYVDGLAASISSIIAMAGDQIIMPENSLMMIHDPAGVAVGTAADMRDLAAILDKIKTNMISVYRQKTGLSEQNISELLTAETWLNGTEAVNLKFADQVIAPIKIAAHFDLSKFKRAPAALRMTASVNSSSINIPHGRKKTMQNEIDYSELEGVDTEGATQWGENKWEKNPGVRAEFVNKESFLAYVRATALGRVRMFGRGVK